MYRSCQDTYAVNISSGCGPSISLFSCSRVLIFVDGIYSDLFGARLGLCFFGFLFSDFYFLVSDFQLTGRSPLLGLAFNALADPKYMPVRMSQVHLANVPRHVGRWKSDV